MDGLKNGQYKHIVCNEAGKKTKLKCKVKYR